MKGNYLPKDAIEILIPQLVKEYTEAFKEAAESLIIEFSSMKKLSNSEIAQFRKRLVDAINSEGQKAMNRTKKELKKMAEASKETKEPGQQNTPTRNPGNGFNQSKN